jgi:hypothetical protein
MAAANALIALGTLVLSGGGTLQGILGHDEAFTVSLALGITVIYGGFLVAARPVPAGNPQIPASGRFDHGERSRGPSAAPIPSSN